MAPAAASRCRGVSQGCMACPMRTATCRGKGVLKLQRSQLLEKEIGPRPLSFKILLGALAVRLLLPQMRVSASLLASWHSQAPIYCLKGPFLWEGGARGISSHYCRLPTSSPLPVASPDGRHGAPGPWPESRPFLVAVQVNVSVLGEKGLEFPVTLASARKEERGRDRTLRVVVVGKAQRFDLLRPRFPPYWTRRASSLLLDQKRVAEIGVGV
jgi:hypothetical protein